MQEDESQPEQEIPPPSKRDTGESQPEPEQRPISKQEDDSESEQEPQLPSERETEEDQPEPEPQPTSEGVAGEGQPEPRLQLRPAAPIPLPPTTRQKRRQYFLGLAFGLIPLIVFLVLIGLYQVRPGLNALGYLILAGLLGSVLYASELAMTSIYLTNKQRRFVGYGLLTAFLTSPVIAVIGCRVLPTLIHP